MTDIQKLIWINLDRATSRRKRCLYALSKGNWQKTERFRAIDSRNKNNVFVGFAGMYNFGSSCLPGINRVQEQNPLRISRKAELACTISWLVAIHKLSRETDFNKDSWYLFMEDDVSSSLSCPEEWPIALKSIINQATAYNAEVIQLCPINGKERWRLYRLWKDSKSILTPKSSVRSHGNGAMLLKGSAVFNISKLYLGHYRLYFDFYLFKFPFNIRPVADKIIYSIVEHSKCFVINYPIFCLDAQDSFLHTSHLKSFHKRSRDVTLNIWKKDGNHKMIDNYMRFRGS